LGKERPKAKNPCNAIEEGLGKRHAKNNAEPERIYLTLPTKEGSTYTFELKD